MPTMRRSLLLALVLGLTLFVAAVPRDAAAHVRPLTAPDEASAPAVPVAEPAIAGASLDTERQAWSAAPDVTVPWPLLAAALALAALGARRPRRALALVLILLAAVFAFESGVHSVHHLADRDGGQQCAVAAASQHISGTEVAAVAADAIPADSPLLAASGALLARTRFTGPDQGRAPPALLA
jgi:hypothetical protein